MSAGQHCAVGLGRFFFGVGRVEPGCCRQTICSMTDSRGTLACSACELSRGRVSGPLDSLCAGHLPALRILRRTDPAAPDEALLRILAALPTNRIPLAWWWELLSGTADSPPSWYWANPQGPQLNDRLVDICFTVSATGELYEFSGNPLIHPPPAIAQAMSERYGTAVRSPDPSVDVEARVVALLAVR